MESRDFHIKSGSTFGKKLDKNLNSKRAVARKTCDLLWEEAVDTLVINDGTSTTYPWCYLLNRWTAERPDHPLGVWTNNRALEIEALCKANTHKIQINGAPGLFSFEFCAALGKDATDWMAE